MKKLFSLLMLALPAVASSHAVFEQPQVTSGSYYKATLGISHGCEGAATTKVSIEIPEGIEHARPMPKTGWKIAITRQALKTPYESHGQTVTEDVSTITWYGGELADDYFDEFVFKAKVSADPQTLYLPVRQTCITGENYWHEIPQGDKKWHEYDEPAPFLEVIAPETSHHH
ncbi:YcnI family protein [Methylophaga sp. OBS4]|uniref:YcnI family copper-binding membrane protein n=1 Tax=Methylophaga sp. OBS4 TaxID=2991935 RepID=UPI002253278D|nr:YcnI family protein [Methylophaga sp. OBS4]MCX4186674.1 YcnI family protein [Methylophaga sp. OBS4]